MVVHLGSSHHFNSIQGRSEALRAIVEDYFEA
ncbi:hypothetical protein GECvBMG_gp111 [Salmonella phage GEC_vB_MG]|nr:hypothetical protein GECvBMG_gp111 [Salmonella phage GEC_vB_MG]